KIQFSRLAKPNTERYSNPSSRVTMITQDRLKELLRYNPKTGILRWKAKTCPNHRVMIGSIAGSKSTKGYLRIMIDGKRYPAHSLIWLLVYGKWPKRLMDHKNLIKNDNRL